MKIVEVGPRDGLQSAPVTLSPERRAQLVRRLIGNGLQRVEAVSFADPRRVPQMAGAEDIAARLSSAGGQICGLVLNERGFERLLDTSMRDARFAFGVSDAFNEVNANCSSDEGLRVALRLLDMAKERNVHLGIVLATAFGCPFAGEIDPREPLRIAEALAAAGAREIVFADTIGVAVPRQVRALVSGSAHLGVKIGIHLHNTRNTGYANVFAALEAGAEIADASIAGLGGCPFAPGAGGNIATEDLVYMLEREGVRTGVDLNGVIETARWLCAAHGLSASGSIHRVPPFPPIEVAGAEEFASAPTPFSTGTEYES